MLGGDKEEVGVDKNREGWMLLLNGNDQIIVFYFDLVRRYALASIVST